MGDQVLADILRGALRSIGLDDAGVNALLKLPLKEPAIAAQGAARFLHVHKVAFAERLDCALLQAGAEWRPPFYDLSGLGVSGTAKLSATEELSAIRIFAPTDDFSPSKALTNALRIIRSCERAYV